jgi:hypothetical protein
VGALWAILIKEGLSLVGEDNILIIDGGLFVHCTIGARPLEWALG